MSETSSLQVPALRISQSPGRVLYAFAVDGKIIPSFAAISRVRREGGTELLGYQRPEVQSHISEIRTYLERPDAMIPNALVVAFDQPLLFLPSASGGESGTGQSVAGTLDIPCMPQGAEACRIGFIVDGQQRLAAIREAEIQTFPIFVVAFVAEGIREQMEQFILVNSTKPLPKGLIYELLPRTSGRLPALLERRRFPAQVSERLNTDVDSPLRGMVRTPTTPDGVVKDNSLLRAIENSLSDGVLYRFRDRPAEPDEHMLPTLKNFWTAVRETFPEAWGLPPKRSRLMHGAGIVSLGFLMDAVTERHRAHEILAPGVFEGDLRPLRDACRWTQGYWDFGAGQQRKWNDIQNTSKDVQLLSNHLLLQYRNLVWSQPI